MLDTASEADVLRFIAEAQVTAQLDHPNIVPIHELGVDEHGQVFYTMKMVRGSTLKAVLAELAAGDPAAVAKYPLPVLLTVFQKVCDALAFAHSRGVIHRDLKPENLMLGDFGSVLVMDWGLAKVLGKTDAPGADVTRSAVISARAAEPEVSATMTGSIMGTPAYMSPEQARGEIETLDARSDIYALGAILFEILHLRPTVTGPDAMSIVEKVARGEVAWLGRVGVPPAVVRVPRNTPPTPGVPPGKGAARRRWFARDAQTGGRDAHPTQRLSASLAAVVRKALALEAAARYARVEDLQVDLLAYQNGFATSAEKAGAWKQFTLFVRRHKAVATSLAAALAVLAAVSAVFTLRVVGEKNRAENALADLKKTAPGLRQLAESKAGFQRFDSALEKLDAAIALNPEYLPGYWRRAWLFIGLNRLPEAAAALRLAQQQDPAHAELAAILPTVEKLADLPAAERWPTEAGRIVWNYLGKVGASGETVALSARLNPNAKEKEKLVRERVEAWLGKGKGEIYLDKNALLHVNLDRLPIDTIEPLRGLPIDDIGIGQTDVANLNPLRGMRLVSLAMYVTKITDLSPLIGMPMNELNLNENKNVDLSPLRGLPLQVVRCAGLNCSDFTPLQGGTLRFFDMARNDARDLNFLADAPLEYLEAHSNQIANLSPLRGKPLRKLILSQNNVRDLSPLRGAPITELSIHHNPLQDLTPLLDLPKLEKLRVSRLGKLLEPLRHHPSLQFIAYDDEPYRPAAECWAAYDAPQAAGPK